MENNVWDERIRTIENLHDLFHNTAKHNYNVDFLFAERMFPAKMKTTLINASRYHPKYIILSIVIQIHKQFTSFDFEITNQDLLEIRKRFETVTAKDILKFFNIYEQVENVKEFEILVDKAGQLQKENGKHLVCNSFGIDNNHTYYNLNTFGFSSSCIVEDELEVDNIRKRTVENDHRSVKLPFVRVFSLMLKKYLYVHIKDVQDYQYNKDAFKKLFLPRDIKEILQKVFSYSTKELIGDFLHQKHGGLIIMAEGNPGTGKTSTAEVFSELNQKPLYTIQVDELGTESTKIESNLNRIFRRVEKWNAIVLLDEADVFLSHRDNQLERSAIVGIFLRLMDYFRGTMFLTTNRSSVIDNAVLSRITMNIKYPDIEKDRSKLIWKSKFEDAGLTIDSFDKISEMQINGRQIRNITRFAKILFDKKIKEDNLIELIRKTLPGDKI